MSPVDLVQCLRDFAKATVETVTAENGEQLTYEDSIIWLAADTLASKDKALAEIRAEREAFEKDCEYWSSETARVCGEASTLAAELERVAKERDQAHAIIKGREALASGLGINADKISVQVARDFATKLKAAESELALVKKALEPFAAAQGHFDGHVRDDDIVDVALRNIRAHHIRAASRALSQDGEERS